MSLLRTVRPQRVPDDDDMSDASVKSMSPDAMEKEKELSFGELLQRQEKMNRKRKRESPDDLAKKAEMDREKLAALKARLQQLREEKERNGTTKKPKLTRLEKVKPQKAQIENEDSDSAPSEMEIQKSRPSKHAPAVRSSKYPVSRKRQVVEVPKNTFRDPRFDPGPPDPHFHKKYAFLQDYRKSEIAELKDALKKTRNEEDREKLRSAIVSRENAVKTWEAQEREQEVRRKHKKEEKERIKQGKKPFYLKQKEIKDRAAVEKFKGMKGKEREKLMERRKRKEGQKEKKKMPEFRRSGQGAE